MKLKEKLKLLDPFTYVDLLLDKINPFPEKTLKREAINWIAYIFFGFIFALIIYNLLGIALQTTHPLVVVVSGSMEPNLFRGDIVILQGKTSINAPEIDYNGFLKGKKFEDIIESNYSGNELKEIKINGKIIPYKKEGDIIVYNSTEDSCSLPKGSPIIHRTIAKINALDGTYFITKGDNNNKGVGSIDQENCKQTICMHSNKLIKIAYSCISTKLVKENKVIGKAILTIPKIGWIKLIILP